MSAKSILVIGDVHSWVWLFSRALMSGYRILYTEDPGDGLSFIDQENVRIVIIGKVTVCMNPEAFAVRSIAKLVGLEIPIILIGRDVSENDAIEIFRAQAPLALPESESTREINNALECFFNGRREEAEESEHLVFRWEKDFISVELNKDGNAQKIQERIKRAMVFMEEHYNEEISLNQIAHAAYLNPYYFCRLFRRQLGTTCSKYLSLLRVKKAKDLLKETDLSVTEICFEVGFNSLTHFERVFKGLEGKTPSVYRASLHQKPC